MKIPVIAIVGPTATRKSEFAFLLAKKLNTEIISADAYQVYKEFSICTAKIGFSHLKEVRHHFINHISVTENYNVSRFVDEAKKIIAEIFSKKKIPIVVGGTGLYVDALLENYQFEKESSGDIKMENQEKKDILIDQIGGLHQNDVKRVSRALIFLNKFGFSINKQKENTLNFKNCYDTLRIGFNFRDRKNLYSAINDRVDNMVKSGLVHEVIDIKQNFSVSKTASAAIGYKELLPFIEGKITLAQAIEDIKIGTRHYAKRQITWFGRKVNNWFYLD
jgi:tRNA dimethylallyltransferase